MEPWWTIQATGLISAIAAVVGGVGAAAACTIGAYCVSRWTYRRLVVSMFAAGLVLGVVLLAASVAALLARQPPYVCFPLLLFGCYQTLVFGALLPVYSGGYQKSELWRSMMGPTRRW